MGEFWPMNPSVLMRWHYSSFLIARFSPVHLFFLSLCIKRSISICFLAAAKWSFLLEASSCVGLFYSLVNQNRFFLCTRWFGRFFFSSHNRFYWLEPLAPPIQTPRKLLTKKIDHCHTAVTSLSALCVIRLIQAYRQKLKCSTGAEHRDGRRGENSRSRLA